jgi:endonuclease/exonuclease/phosphatase family metal-dependent hydrolase
VAGNPAIGEYGVLRAPPRATIWPVPAARPLLHRSLLAGAAAVTLLITGAVAGCSSGQPAAGTDLARPTTSVPVPTSSASTSPAARPQHTVPGGKLTARAPHRGHARPGHRHHGQEHGKNHGRHQRQHQAPAVPLVSEPFTVASFNTLGAAHTARGGNKPGMPGATVRTLRMIDVLRRHQVDVVGLQEFETPQANLFRRRASGTYAYWHPPGRSANAIAWRRDRFALVEARSQPVHYFGGRIQPMPVVLLRDLSNPTFEFWVLNVHNPASTRWHPGNKRWRNVDMVREHALARSLVATGHPVLFTGDMNERAPAFCAFTRDGVLRAAQGGSHEGGRCRPPAAQKIDWIFGSQHVLFSNFRIDRSPLVRKTTDHSVVLAEAQLLSSAS